MTFIHTLIMIVVFTTPITVHAQEVYIELTESLAEHGHRDIAISEQGDSLFVSVWPYGFRDPYRGFADAVETIHADESVRASDSIRHVAVTVTQWGLPTVTGYLGYSDPLHRARFSRLGHQIPVDHERSVLMPSPRLSLLFDIPITVHFGEHYDPLVFKTGIRPELRVRLFHNVTAYAQVAFYAHNEYDPHEWYRPESIGVADVRWFGRRVAAVTNVGAFRPEIYGIDQEWRITVVDDRVRLGIHAGYYGNLWFEDDTFFYDDLEYAVAIGSAELSFPRYDARVKIHYGKYLYGDRGTGVTVERTFDEVDFGFTGVWTEDDIAANVYFRVPFFPAGRTSRVRYGIGMHDRFGFAYDYYANNLAKEPGIPLSHDRIQGTATPGHFDFMSRWLDSE